MPEHRVSRLETSGEEHCGPYHAVKTGDILADEVVLHRPILVEFLRAVGIRIADAGEVREQCISPHVGDMALVERQGDAPVERRAGNGEVLQAALDERHDLVAARLGANEVRMALVEVEQRLLELAQLEEPVLLARGHELDGALAVGADELAIVVTLEVAFGVVGLLMDAIPPLIT